MDDVDPLTDPDTRQAARAAALLPSQQLQRLVRNAAASIPRGVAAVVPTHSLSQTVGVGRDGQVRLSVSLQPLEVDAPPPPVGERAPGRALAVVAVDPSPPTPSVALVSRAGAVATATGRGGYEARVTHVPQHAGEEPPPGTGSLVVDSLRRLLGLPTDEPDRTPGLWMFRWWLGRARDAYGDTDTQRRLVAWLPDRLLASEVGEPTPERLAAATSLLTADDWSVVAHLLDSDGVVDDVQRRWMGERMTARFIVGDSPPPLSSTSDILADSAHPAWDTLQRLVDAAAAR